MTPLPGAERAAERSPAVQRSRARSLEHANVIIEAAVKLVRERGDEFTTQELVEEAGVALQTFYRHFGGKDQLLLAVIEHMVSEAATANAAAAAHLVDPIERLHFYITSVFDSLDAGDDQIKPARFLASTHWRLQRIFPEEIAAAMQPFTDLIHPEIAAATAAGDLASTDPVQDAWFVNHLVRSAFHHYAYAPDRPPALRDDLWRFCLRALGGSR